MTDEPRNPRDPAAPDTWSGRDDAPADTSVMPAAQDESVGQAGWSAGEPVPDGSDGTGSTGGPGGTGGGDGPDGSDDRVSTPSSPLRKLGRFAREIVIVVVVALIASALLRAFVVQAFFVPSGSMLPEINLHDRILVSRIGDVERGEVVVFEDPGNWIPAAEEAQPPTGIRKALEWVGVLPASGHEHLVKRVIGLPGDHVVCCTNGHLVINDVEVDESDFIKPGDRRADNVSFDVLVPKDSIFVLGDNRYVSGDSSRHPNGQEAFVPMDLVTGRAFAVIWPRDHMHILHIPDAYADVPDGQTPPDEGVFNQPGTDGP